MSITEIDRGIKCGMGSTPTVTFQFQNKVEDEVKILGERQVSSIASSCGLAHKCLSLPSDW